MKSFFLILTAVGLISILDIDETEEGVVYFVHPTKLLSFCPGNGSCPPGQICHTLDGLVEHSSKFFSSEYVNVTLVFMCGIHNYTKDLTVQNLYSFVMKGTADSKENLVINHQFGKASCTTIQFFNISFVNITALTMICPSIYVNDSFITVKSSSLYGSTDTKETLSSITVTGRNSCGLLNNCTFKENCIIVSNFSDGITVSNSTFQSYIHQSNSIIEAISSVVTLAGNVNFTDSFTGFHSSTYSSGTAVFLRTNVYHPEFKSSLIIATGATVYFVNLTSNNHGGAVYGENGVISFGVETRVVFMNNVAKFNGGAICMTNGMIIVNTDADLNFSNNSVLSGGGAAFLENTTIRVESDAIHFYNNRGKMGGAMYFRYGTMYINSNRSSVMFIKNTAQLQGGAIYVEAGVSSSIIVDNSSKLLLFNNSAFQGGALYIIPSSFTIKVGYESSVQFINNTATDVGGAVYSEMQSAAPCLFMVTDYSAELSFIGNHVNRSIGHHMYGTSIRYEKCDEKHVLLANKRGKPYCFYQSHTIHERINISFNPGLNETLSPVSSAPWRVCLCDSNGKPQCANLSQIFANVSVYRGDTFMLSTCIVGYDFGTTVGNVYARFLYSNESPRLEQSQYNQPVNESKKCSPLKYTIYSNHDEELLQLQTSVLPLSLYVDKKNAISTYKESISNDIADFISNDNGCLREVLLTTPVFINIKLFPGCPPGLTLNHDHTKCSCFSVLANNGFKCSIQNKTGYLKWNSTVWVNATFNESQSNGIIYNHFCSPYYCKSGEKTINIGDDPSKQCASNRTGILCGGCMENFSLAIGSSRCIECPNSHNMALVLAFAAAGVFLVIFILALNLTVTQGLINGLIFYANIVWAYKIILFPPEIQENHWLIFLQVFIAWLNLDFGIESCFFVGLDAYWKTWLQFLFPFYIWAIAGVITVACRYSSCLTNLIGSRVVSLLATLFLLSYMKLLGTIIDATSVAVIARYPQNTSYAVWYLDGNLRYCQHPHIYLFIAAVATLVFLWLPYTLLLLFIQPLRRVSHLRPLKWINRLAPVYDAYFSPLKDKHQYWFGTMLLVRGVLLIILTITSGANPELNVLILLLLIAFLRFFISVQNVYKQMNVSVLESSTSLNLIVLSAGALYKWESIKSKTILLSVSIGIAFAQFCVIVVWSLIKPCSSAGWRCRQKQTYDIIDDNINSDITHERIEDPELEDFISLPKNNNYAPKATY